MLGCTIKQEKQEGGKNHENTETRSGTQKPERM
jgi:hypothetical protein